MYRYEVTYMFANCCVWSQNAHQTASDLACQSLSDMCDAIHGLAPRYLNELCIPVSTVPYLSALRSAARGDLVVPRTSLKLGNRAFCVADPVAWNSLPLH